MLFRRLFAFGAIAVLAACGGSHGAGLLPSFGPNALNGGMSEPVLATIKINKADAARVMAQVSRSGAHGALRAQLNPKPKISPQFNLTYHGGPTLSQAGSVNVYINKTASNWSFPGDFIDRYSKSSLNDLMEVYTGGKGSNRYPFIGGINATYDTSNVLGDSDIFTILKAAQAAFASSGQTRGYASTGYHVIYHIFLDNGVSGCTNFPPLGKFCYGGSFDQNICAYHGNVDINGVGHILYTVEPWQERQDRFANCESPSGTLQDSMASFLSHELSETITDPDTPYGAAWYNSSSPGQEIGDICEGYYGEFGPIQRVTYNIQKEWLNDHACTFGPLPPANITEFQNGLTAGSHPVGITGGPDGNLWFTEYDANRIGRITPGGVVTEFSAGITGSGLDAIAKGPDGNLWFTETKAHQIGRITPAGVVTEFSTGISGKYLNGITGGPDGNLWFTESPSEIGRITPAGVVTEFSSGISTGSDPYGITSGPDGNLWFTEGNGQRIGRITPAGVVTEFSNGISGAGRSITSGPDGNLWFTQAADGSNFSGPIDQIGRITPAGAVTEFSNGISQSSRPLGIASGPDGNLWFTEAGSSVGGVDRIGRITPAGVVTEFDNGLTPNSLPARIASGADGNLWFTEPQANQIGRLTPPRR